MVAARRRGSRTGGVATLDGGVAALERWPHWRGGHTGGVVVPERWLHYPHSTPNDRLGYGS